VIIGEEAKEGERCMIKRNMEDVLQKIREEPEYREEIYGFNLREEIKSARHPAGKEKFQPIRCLGSLQMRTINSEGKAVSVKSVAASFKLFDNETIIKEISSGGKNLELNMDSCTNELSLN
jgi:hypothetical protein